MRFQTALVTLALAATTFTAAAQDPSLNEELRLLPGAQDLPIRFENVTLEDGLTQSTIYSILQDRKGFMWFGAQVGLNRYDGHTVRNYLPDPFDSTSIHDSWVWAIVEAPGGMLWLTYEDGTVSHFDPSTGISRNYPSSDTDSTRLRPGRTLNLTVDSKGRVWVGGASLQLLDPETGKVTRYGSGPWNGGANGWVGGIIEEEGGTLIVTGLKGIFRFDPDTGTYDHLIPLNIGGWRPARDPADPALLWLGSFAGVLRVNVETREHRVFDVSRGPNDFVSQARPDPSDPGVVWASSTDGVARLDAASGQYRLYRANTGDMGGQSSDGGLLSNAVGAVYADRAGILWVAAEGAGVSRFDPTAIGFGKDASRPDDPNSMRGQQVWSMAVAADNVLWVAAVGSETSDPGWYLNRIDRRSGRVTYWKTNTSLQSPLLVDRRGTVLFGAIPDVNVPMSNGVLRYDERRGTLVPEYTVANGLVPNDRIWDIREAANGDHLVATDGGVVRINPLTKARTAWTPDEKRSDALHDGRTRWILEDKRGDLWVSAIRDLVRIDGATGAVERVLDRPDMPELADNAIADYPTEDASGNIWWVLSPNGVGTMVLRYDAAADRFSSYERNMKDRTAWSGGQITGITVNPEDPDKIWFTTYGAGLSLLTISTGKFRHYRVEDGLTNQAAYEAIFDNEGMLWIPTNSGLFEFNPETESFRRFGLEYGLQSLEFNGGSVARSSNGEMFFGGVRGFNAFFPSQLRSNDVPPDVAITDFLLFNQTVVPGPDSPLQRSISDTEVIRLRHDQDAPSFRFAALHYKRPEANQIRYRLEPQEAEWVDAAGRDEVSYTNLAPGEYTFRVIAANSDGVWNAEGASVRLIISPPWWTTWWAYVFYAVGLAGSVFGVDRWQRARIMRKEVEARRLQELESAKEIETAYRQLQQTKEQLVQQEKLASLGSLTAGIAHEIKNPLNFVNNFAEVNAELAEEAREAMESGDLVAARKALADLGENATQIAKHGKRADSIVKAMMQHARGGASELETIDVNTFVDEYVGLAWHGLRARDDRFRAEVVRDFAPDAGTLAVMPQELGRVVLNLLNNAFHAVQEQAAASEGDFKPAVTVGTRRTSREVEITVTDNGPGIKPALREKIFEPFYTTKATGEGTGLGLSLSFDIVTKGHGGTLSVEEGPGGGARFVVALPG